jgi:ATPase subunit of ABC transporter with duplicated ATPase domains
MLEASGLTVEVGGRPILEDASLSLYAGDKVGLVGRNGAGKTSLLRFVSGTAPVGAGTVRIQGALGYLPQDPGLRHLDPTLTALAHVLSGRGLAQAAERLEELRAAMERDHASRTILRYSRAEEAFRAAGGYSAESEARRIAAGLGLAPDRLDRPVSVLSGGERRRMELARILFAGSDVLLLDEPTNHLDTDAKAWLMKFLATYRGALMVVSHDLTLLDASITRILHLDDGGLTEYRGTYSQYREARRRDEERLRKTAVRQEQEIRRLSTLADSMRHQTVKRARVAKTLDTRVERLRAERVTGPKRERRYSVRFPQPPHCGRAVLTVEGLSKSYGGPAVFQDVSFALARGERLLVMGLNGAGKTSLLRIFAGESVQDAGDVRFGAGVSVGYYAQEHEGIEPGRTVLDHMTEGTDVEPQRLRALLGMFGLTGEIAFQDAGTLSGGEKTKLSLAQLVAGRHNLLLLDEPTNNLDPPSREGVATALGAWPGTMVIVSHDREFVEALEPERVLMMPDGTLDYWSDDLLDLVSLA